jgi:hypothetical protein
VTKYTHKCPRCGEELKASTKRLLFVATVAHENGCAGADLAAKIQKLRSADSPKNSTSPADKEDV